MIDNKLIIIQNGGGKNHNSRGFVTIATGKDIYYQLAVNLLHSYRKATPNPLPFAIICDKENQYTKEFDKVVILENASCTYMDKLTMLSIPPFDFNIFIDADCLAYGDLNKLFEIERNNEREGVWTFGRTNSLESHDGWFTHENTGEYKDKIKYLVDLHGGIVFFRSDPTTVVVYHTCLEISQKYASFKFQMFEKPADEPILALAMAVNGLKPINKSKTENANYYLFYPTAKQVKVDISQQQLSYTFDDTIWHHDVLLMHWQNSNCSKALYLREVEILNNGQSFKSDIRYHIRHIKEMILKYKGQLGSFVFSLFHK